MLGQLQMCGWLERGDAFLPCCKLQANSCWKFFHVSMSSPCVPSCEHGTQQPVSNHGLASATPALGWERLLCGAVPAPSQLLRW